MHLIYGFDPLCGWCYGGIDALSALRRDLPDLPIHMVLPGLFTGPRVGPYAEMEDYIRGAMVRLEAVTGRAPSETFFEMIRQDGVRNDSGPPCLVLAAARDTDPALALDLAVAMITAHFRDGADLGDPATYPPLLAQVGLQMDLPDLAADPEPLWRAEAAFGIQSFPTYLLYRDEKLISVPTEYDADRLVEMVRDRMTG